jgi:hypothetical protein
MTTISNLEKSRTGDAAVGNAFHSFRLVSRHAESPWSSMASPHSSAHRFFLFLPAGDFGRRLVNPVTTPQCESKTELMTHLTQLKVPLHFSRLRIAAS